MASQRVRMKPAKKIQKKNLNLWRRELVFFSWDAPSRGQEYLVEFRNFEVMQTIRQIVYKYRMFRTTQPDKNSAIRSINLRRKMIHRSGVVGVIKNGPGVRVTPLELPKLGVLFNCRGRGIVRTAYHNRRLLFIHCNQGVIVNNVWDCYKTVVTAGPCPGCIIFTNSIITG